MCELNWILPIFRGKRKSGEFLLPCTLIVNAALDTGVDLGLKRIFESVTRIKRVAGSWPKAIKSGVLVAKNLGLGVFLDTLKTLLTSKSQSISFDSYKSWVDQNFHRNAEGIQLQNPIGHPVFSVVMPVHNPSMEQIQASVSSVLSQDYASWELCICDDNSRQEIRVFLSQLPKLDGRIRMLQNETTLNISETSNKASLMAGGRFLVFLDQDDELSSNALQELATCLAADSSAAFVYSDEDKLDENGNRCEPHFKPANVTEIARSYNVFCHLMCISSQLFKDIGGFDSSMNGAQDWDLALRALETIEKTEGFTAYHIPKILYHWRKSATSTAASIGAKPYVEAAGRATLESHFRRCGIQASLSNSLNVAGAFEICYRSETPEPSVLIVIPTRNGLEILKPCLESVLRFTSYSNYSICIVDNGSDDAATLSYLESVSSPRVSVIRDPSPFNYSAINNRAIMLSPRSQFICLLNNDVEVFDGDWLTRLMSIAQRKTVGAVGPKLLYPDGTVQHAGVVLGMGEKTGVAGHWQKNSSLKAVGYMGRLALTSNFSAVTGACLLVSRENFDLVTGLDESLAVGYNDIDFCLKLQNIGLENVCFPSVQLRHHESRSRGYEDSPEKLARAASEVYKMRKKWALKLQSDACFNPNLSLENELVGLAFPPRSMEARLVTTKFFRI